MLIIRVRVRVRVRVRGLGFYEIALLRLMC